MAEVCPFCGSKDTSVSTIGLLEKAVEAPTTGVIAVAGKIGYAIKSGGKSLGPSGFLGTLAGNLVDGVCSSVANSLTKNIPTGRRCNQCGKTFHSTPDKGWYDK